MCERQVLFDRSLPRPVSTPYHKGTITSGFTAPTKCASAGAVPRGLGMARDPLPRNLDVYNRQTGDPERIPGNLMNRNFQFDVRSALPARIDRKLHLFYHYNDPSLSGPSWIPDGLKVCRMGGKYMPQNLLNISG